MKWMGEGGCGGGGGGSGTVKGAQKGRAGEKSKSRVEEDKLCKDTSQLRGEIKPPYGSAVSRNTICPAASSNRLQVQPQDAL